MQENIVIGAGVAGIAMALRLRKRGAKVLVLEKNDYIGGKMNQYDSKGYRWDTGPSLFTMPHFVDELYELHGKNPRDFFNYKKHDEACRYFFNDDTKLTFYTDRTRLKQEVSEKLQADAALVDQYLDRSAENYETIGDMFLNTAIHKPSQLPWGEILKMSPKFLRSNLFGSLNGYNKKMLKDHDKLVQIFNRYVTYNGSDPYRASGVFNLIAHLEHNVGTFFPIGGMRQIVEGLYELAKSVGVEFKFGVDVASCKPLKKGFEVVTQETTYQTERLICAIDCVSFYKNILKDEALYNKYKQKERSTSALIYYLGVNKSYDQLGLHNIFFSEDYAAEFKKICGDQQIDADGTIYVHISSKSDENDAPKGGENWFMMLNVPADSVVDDSNREQIKQTLIKRIEAAIGEPVAPHIETELMWAPKQIAADTGAYMGSLYGSASNTKLAALTRHPNFSKKYKGLYFCGGTVHPGGGIPLSIKSAKIVDELIAQER